MGIAAIWETTKEHKKEIIALLTAPATLSTLLIWEDRLDTMWTQTIPPLWQLRILATLLAICIALATLCVLKYKNEKFVEEAGALFKKNKDGAYNLTPYCPKCRSAMYNADRTSPYQCGKKDCEQKASFNFIHLNDVMSRLP